MAITVIRRPIGHKLTTEDISAQIIDSGTDTAMVYTGSAHGLSDGDYVYIESNFDSYNGFKYVDSIAYDSFKIKDSEGGDYVPFKQNADITFRISVLNHGWQCVHLPIVYELHSDLFPLDQVDFNIGRYALLAFDDNGYSDIPLSANISVSVLDYVRIKNVNGNGSADGIYQVITVTASDRITIDLSSTAGGLLTADDIIVKYYKNYFISVKVYGGLPDNHPWYDEKPMELLATLKFTPDSFNNIKLSIAEILRGQITLRNNLTLDSLPNNIDFFTSFYIAYFESYDTSDGETITQFTGSETVDTFTGYATNSILPFKSESISHLSDYVNEDSYLARWLTVQDRPVAIVDHFFDLSFINQLSDRDIQIEILKYTNGVVIDSEYLTLNNPGAGIIRVPITPETGVDQYCIQAMKPLSSPFPPLSDYVNIAGAGVDWTTGSSPTVSLPIGSTTDPLRVSYIMPSGSYTFMLNRSLVPSAVLTVSFRNGSTVVAQRLAVGNGTFNITLLSSIDNIQFTASPTVGLSAVITITDFTLVMTEDNITEQICIDILEECNGTFTNDNLRITEGGVFRELE